MTVMMKPIPDGSGYKTAMFGRHIALYYGLLGLVTLLLAACASEPVSPQDEPLSPQEKLAFELGFAARSGDLEAVRTLLDAGADIEAKDSAGHTSLHFTALNANPEVAAVLLERGADIGAENIFGVMPAGYASESNENPRVLATLLKQVANVDIKFAEGSTLLHVAAASNDNPAVAALLLDRGADRQKQ